MAFMSFSRAYMASQWSLLSCKLPHPALLNKLSPLPVVPHASPDQESPGLSKGKVYGPLCPGFIPPSASDGKDRKFHGGICVGLSPVEE